MSWYAMRACVSAMSARACVCIKIVLFCFEIDRMNLTVAYYRATCRWYTLQSGTVVPDWSANKILRALLIAPVYAIRRRSQTCQIRLNARCEFNDDECHLMNGKKRHSHSRWYIRLLYFKNGNKFYMFWHKLNYVNILWIFMKINKYNKYLLPTAPSTWFVEQRSSSRMISLWRFCWHHWLGSSVPWVAFALNCSRRQWSRRSSALALFDVPDPFSCSLRLVRCTQSWWLVCVTC